MILGDRHCFAAVPLWESPMEFNRVEAGWIILKYNIVSTEKTLKKKPNTYRV